jgi:hypothetical protein
MGLQPSVVYTTRYTSQPANKSNAATALLAAMDACAEEAHACSVQQGLPYLRQGLLGAQQLCHGCSSSSDKRHVVTLECRLQQQQQAYITAPCTQTTSAFGRVNESTHVHPQVQLCCCWQGRSSCSVLLFGGKSTLTFMQCSDSTRNACQIACSSSCLCSFAPSSSCTAMTPAAD